MVMNEYPDGPWTFKHCSCVGYIGHNVDVITAASRQLYSDAVQALDISMDQIGLELEQSQKMIIKNEQMHMDSVDTIMFQERK